MKVEFEGRTWQLDTTDVSVDQAMAIASYTGLTLRAWEDAFADPDKPGFLKAIRCLYWVMREQNSEPVPMETANFAVIRFYMAVGQSLAADAAPAEAEEDPTNSGDGPDAEPPPPPAESLPGSNASSTAI